MKLHFARTAHFLAAVVIAVGATAAWAQGASPGHAAPFGASSKVADRYIVVFKDHVGNPHAEANGLVQAAGGRLVHS